MKSNLIQQYISYVLDNNQSPESVYVFAKSLGMEESEFYNYFSSLETIEMSIYSEWFDSVLQTCEQSSPWQNYSAREKVLTIFYAFIEKLKEQRSFVKYLHGRDFKKLPHWPNYLRSLKESFDIKMKAIISDGIESKELMERKYIDSKYTDGLWLNFLFIIKFWVEDHSMGFEKTDAAIEKSINLAFDLMGRSAMDTAIDFGKFLFQNK